MNFSWRWTIILISFGIVLFGAVAFWTFQTSQGQAMLEMQVNGASLSFSASPSVVWLRGQCTTVHWQVEGVSAVFIEGEGVIGTGEMPVCVRPRYLPRMVVETPNSPHRYVYDLPVVMVSETAAVQAAFWGMLGLWAMGLWLAPPVWRRWAALNLLQKLHYIILLALILLGVGIRLLYLQRPVAFDEGWTLYEFVRLPTFYQMISDYEEPNNHILHSILVRLADQSLGHAPWIFRLPAFISGVLLVPLAYWLGRRFYNPQVALWTAALTATAFRLIDYSVEARGYTLLALICGLLLLNADVLRRPSAPRWAWASYAALSALGFYTIPIMVYALGAISLWLLVCLVLESPSPVRWRRLVIFALVTLASAGLTLALYSPVILRNADWLFNNFMAQPLERTTLDIWRSSFEQIRNFILDRYAQPFAIFLGLGFVLGLGLHWRMRPERLPLPIAALLWWMAILAYQRLIPPDRTWIYTIIPFLMVASAGWEFVGSRLLKGRVWQGVVTGSALGIALLLAFGLVNNGQLAESSTGVAISGAEATVLYWRDQDLNQSAMRPTSAVMTRPTADQSLRFYLDYYRLENPPILTHYFYGHEAEEMATLGRRIFVFGYNWPRFADFTAERGVELDPAGLGWQSLATYDKGWALYEVLQAP